MLQTIKQCPLIAKLRNGKTINCQYDVTVKGMEAMELTVNSLIEVAVNLYKQGFDVYAVDIDKAKIKADNVLQGGCL